MYMKLSNISFIFLVSTTLQAEPLFTLPKEVASASYSSLTDTVALKLKKGSIISNEQAHAVAHFQTSGDKSVAGGFYTATVSDLVEVKDIDGKVVYKGDPKTKAEKFGKFMIKSGMIFIASHVIAEAVASDRTVTSSETTNQPVYSPLDPTRIVGYEPVITTITRVVPAAASTVNNATLTVVGGYHAIDALLTDDEQEF